MAAGPRTEELIEWFDREIAAADSFNLPVKYREAMEFFNDPEWRADLGQELVMELFRKVGSQRLARTRPGGVVQLRDEVVARDKFNRRASVMEVKMLRWFERAEGTHHALGKMRRPQLLKAAEEREVRARREILRAKYMRAIAERMPDDDTEVDAVWTDDQLQELWNQMVQDFEDGL